MQLNNLHSLVAAGLYADFVCTPCLFAKLISTIVLAVCTSAGLVAKVGLRPTTVY